MIEGDSAEYEYLTEAVQMSAAVNGMCCEIGVRRGMGSKAIIDAVAKYCPGKVVIGVDPWGNIPYIGREPVGETRYDYTNAMRAECISDLMLYSQSVGVNWMPFIMTDEWFFVVAEYGVEVYEDGKRLEDAYSMIHLDGPHTVAALQSEIWWFHPRTNSGATLVIDDVTPDFVDIAPVAELLDLLGWELIKMGNKKGLWRKK